MALASPGPGRYAAVVALYKRGDVYYYEFVRNGIQHRKSTGTGNIKDARDIETAAKQDIALQVKGLPAKHRKAVPLLSQYIETQFLPSTLNMKERTKRFYKLHAGILAKSSMGNVPLDHITIPMIQAYAFHRRKKLKVSTVNRDLATLRRIFHLAVEDQTISTMPRVRLLGGEERRERVITEAEEAAYLDKAAPLLKDVATLLFDLGLRPDECFRLRVDNFRDGLCHIFKGKRQGSRRRIPCSARVLEVVARRSEGGRGSTLLFWTLNKAGVQRPIDGSSIKKQHAKALKASKVDPFVIYDIRHTAITRWSKRVSSAIELKHLAGHKSLQTTERYIHEVDEDRLRVAVLGAAAPAQPIIAASL
jgi:integrase